ncbi:MAG: cytochrome-c peroxidase, partial [Thiovulaceae bacterium]|nr:cytochrome-c peroxidase [Sulfurimonadaceae bacterium]
LINNPKNKLTKDKIKLGKILYFDPRLSKSGLISCNTCHNLGLGGMDGVSAAIGHKWTANPHHLNSPTVYNAVFNTVQMWDGRFKDLEEQAGGPVQAGPEMAAPKELVLKRLNSIPAYVKAFKKVFGEVSFYNMQKAIAAFERTLVTPSAYDRFLEGNNKALSNNAKRGLKTFIDKGCVSCHNGVGLGGTMQSFPVMGTFKHGNVGDFKGDKNGMVKVPTLRNITQTAPYFHNGTVWDLAEAVQIMAQVQLGTTLSKQETKDIVAFLYALTGNKPTVTYPQLPASRLSTPKPDAN